MADDQNGEDYKLTLAQQIFGKAASAIAGLNSPVPESNDASEIKVTSVVAQHAPVSDASPSAAASLEPIQSEVPQKQLKTAGELAEMIELDLGRHPDSPKAGFQVTVYGWPRWRAMLTIKPAAGPVRNPHEWRDLTNELAERLRKRYDLAWE
jgi:hypothetical protein